MYSSAASRSLSCSQVVRRCCLKISVGPRRGIYILIVTGKFAIEDPNNQYNPPSFEIMRLGGVGVHNKCRVTIVLCD